MSFRLMVVMSEKGKKAWKADEISSFTLATVQSPRRRIGEQVGSSYPKVVNAEIRLRDHEQPSYNIVLCACFKAETDGELVSQEVIDST